MKLQQIEFKKPVKVIQIFKNIHQYYKTEKSFDLRKDQMKWNNVHSKSGFKKGDVLFLPESFLERKDFQLCEMILLGDNVSGKQSVDPKAENQYFLPAPSWRFDIFEIKKNLDIFFRYNEYDIGMPKRDDFKLATLKPGSPLVIKINGKSDFTMSAGKERVYKDQQYILVYLGLSGSATILKEPFSPEKKVIPTSGKVINLLKTLW